jgi:hypothetical protein
LITASAAMTGKKMKPVTTCYNQPVILPVKIVGSRKKVDARVKFSELARRSVISIEVASEIGKVKKLPLDQEEMIEIEGHRVRGTNIVSLNIEAGENFLRESILVIPNDCFPDDFKMIVGIDIIGPRRIVIDNGQVVIQRHDNRAVFGWKLL